MTDFRDEEVKKEPEQPGEGSLSSRLLVDKGRERKVRSFKSRVILSIGALLGVLVLVLGGWLLLDALAPEDENGDEIITITDLSSVELVTRMEVTAGDAAYALEKDAGGKWVNPEKKDVAIDQSVAGSMANYCVSLIALEIVEDSGDKADQYGLTEDAPRMVATLKDGSKQVYRVGSPTFDRKGYYLMKEGDPKIYIVNMVPGQRLSAAFDSLRDLTLPTVDPKNISIFNFTRSDGQVVEIQYKDTGVLVIGYTLTSPYEVAADINIVQDLFDMTTAIKLDSFVTEDTSDLAKYGLGAGARSFTIVDGTGQMLHMKIGSQDEEGKFYAQVLDMPGIYTVGAANLAFFDYTIFALVDKFSTIVDITSVDSLELIHGGGKDVVSIERTPKLDEEGEEELDDDGNVVMADNFFFNGQKAHDRHTRQFYQDIIGLIVDGEVADPDKVTGEPVLTTVFRRNRGSVREIVTEYLPYDADHYAVRKNGDIKFYILKSKVQVAFDSLEEYRENYTKERDKDWGK